MDYLFELGLFAGKSLLVVAAIGAILILFFGLLARVRQSSPILSVENMNERFDDMADTLKGAVLDEKALKADEKEAKKKSKAARKDKNPPEKSRLFVLDFQGDVRAIHVENLREEISAVLTIARGGRDEVILRLESPGGMAHAYGLAAAQLMRVRQAGIKLTIAVDKVAASGGYMMACTADRILAAPFAILGSIGVVAQVPNFHRLLKKHDVDFEEITAGEFKRTVSLFGEITEKGRQKFNEQLEETHQLFKVFVKDNRPGLDVDRVATGEYWFGKRALELGLVDEIVSSDEYIFRQRETAEIFKVEMHVKKRWSEKLAENMATLLVSALERTWSKTHLPGGA